MIDINLIRQEPDLVRTSLQNRQKDPSLVDKFLKIYEQEKILLQQLESKRAEQNALGRSIKGKPTPEQIESGSLIKKDVKVLEDKVGALNVDSFKILEQIPNISAPDVPVGKDDSENVVWKTVGEPQKFNFPVRDHVDLGEILDIIDIKKAGEISGSRFGYFKGQGAVLEMAVMFYAFKKLIGKGFTGMIPPAMIKSLTEWECGYTSNENLFNAAYSIPEDDLIFISSSEHSVVPYHRGEILDASKLPLKYVNYSPCFRREAGTYGKDTRGLFRVHYFNKVEMNIFTLPNIKISDAMCLEMLSIEEEILGELKIPYQVMHNCTGDLPQPNRRMYDINSWFPGQNTYRETSSCSNCTDYQARRLNTKVKIDGKNEFVHILNATVVTDRLVLAIIENFQSENGSVIIPEVLVPFTGFDRIEPPTL